jgi:phosphohistidine phosphatase
MRRLLLLRHAKSDRSLAGVRDHDRPLNARGREAAALMGGYMNSHRLIPDRAAVSTSMRTRETWLLLAAGLGIAPAAVYEERIYEARPAVIGDVIAATPAGVRTLLVIGHNPGLQALALTLVGSGDDAGRRSLVEKFPTAALAVIDFPFDDWRQLAASSGRLERFVTPRQVAATVD